MHTASDNFWSNQIIDRTFQLSKLEELEYYGILTVGTLGKFVHVLSSRLSVALLWKKIWLQRELASLQYNPSFFAAPFYCVCYKQRLHEKAEVSSWRFHRFLSKNSFCEDCIFFHNEVDPNLSLAAEKRTKTRIDDSPISPWSILFSFRSRCCWSWSISRYEWI